MHNLRKAMLLACLLVAMIFYAAVPGYAFVMVDPGSAPPADSPELSDGQNTPGTEEEGTPETEGETEQTRPNTMYVDGKSLSYIRELAQENAEIEFSNNDVVVGLNALELIEKLEGYYAEEGLEDFTIFEVEFLRDYPTPNGIYIGFYVKAKPVPMVFDTPFTARVKFEEGYEGLECRGPDGAVESSYDEAAGEMVIALYSEGEYIFMLDETLNTRPPSALSEPETEATDDEETGEEGTEEEEGSSSSGDRAIPLGVPSKDFFLVIAAAVVLAIFVRIAVKAAVRSTNRSYK